MHGEFHSAPNTERHGLPMQIVEAKELITAKIAESSPAFNNQLNLDAAALGMTMPEYIEAWAYFLMVSDGDGRRAVELCDFAERLVNEGDVIGRATDYNATAPNGERIFPNPQWWAEHMVSLFYGYRANEHLANPGIQEHGEGKGRYRVYTEPYYVYPTDEVRDGERYWRAERSYTWIFCHDDWIPGEFTTECSCGRLFNSVGQPLAPRSQWCEDTEEDPDEGYPGYGFLSGQIDYDFDEDY